MKQVTSKKAVLDALLEFDSLGREEFLEKYGFGPALSYFIFYDGKQYDSKAIYGAAYGLENPTEGPLTSTDFSGGEIQVKGPLEALGFSFSKSNSVPSESQNSPISISPADIALIASARGKAASGTMYLSLSEEEISAIQRTSEILSQLAKSAFEALNMGNVATIAMTSQYSSASGVRGYVPKDLWFAIYPTANKDNLAGNPQIFMIVSERGVEYGFGAAVHPNDFSNAGFRQKVRETAPIVFQNLPMPGSNEAEELGSRIQAAGNYYFRRKHRLSPAIQDFPSFDQWLRFLMSAEGRSNASGTISRYVTLDNVSKVDFEQEVRGMAELFRPMLMRKWHSRPAVTTTLPATPAEKKFAFADCLEDFLAAYGRRRSEAFSIDAEIKSSMDKVRGWLQTSAAVATRSNLKVDISVGQGGWTKTPWIAILDTRVTTSTQRGIYVVLLISEDLSRIYLTLNQGMTELRNKLGQAGAVQEMRQVAESIRPKVQSLTEHAYLLDDNIDLGSETTAAGNYEIGTIAHFDIQRAEIPDDLTINELLEQLLSAYQKITTKEDVMPDLPSAGPSKAEGTPYSIEDALKDLFLDQEEIEHIIEVWRAKKNIILQGAPGVGKSFVAKRLAQVIVGRHDNSKIQAIQFHQSYSYEDFVRGYRPNGMNGFSLSDGIFFEFCQRALAEPQQNFVMIVDEINRGNLSKIFGELMLLIETDKRGPDWGIRLAYSTSAEPNFFVPDNLFIVGMMNTADRSLSLVDYALRRRFSFAHVEPKFGSPKFKEFLSSKGVSSGVIGRIVSRMGALNEAIEADKANLGRGFKIGHSFFTPSESISDSEKWYKRIVETEIYPLLQEYWFDADDEAEHWLQQLNG